MSRSTPHCPACAAPLPPIDRQQIVTCDSCGTDCNADYRAAPMSPPRSPPLSPKRTWSADYDDPERWEAGAFVHLLRTEADPARRLELARKGCGQLHGDEALLWAPAIGDGVLEAEKAGNHELAAELAFQLYVAGVGHREYPYHFRDEARNRDWPLRASDLALDRPIESKAAWILMSVASRVLEQSPGSRAGLIALCGAGTPALQAFTTAAERAEATGDEAGLTEALGCIRTLLVRTVDDERFGVLFDAAAHLLPRLTGRTQQAVIDGLAEVADRHYWRWGPDWAIGEHLKEYPENWRGPEDVLTPLLSYADDLLHERPELARRLLGAIAAGTRRQYCDKSRWKEAMQAVASPEGREACLETYTAIFGPEPQPEEEWRHPRDDSPQPAPQPIIPESDTPPGIRLARARDGQAPCPACGRALQLRQGQLIVTCDHCGQRARVAREARHIRKALDAGIAAELHTWDPRRLVSTMVETDDESLREAIARELASATSDGARYVELAPALVAYMMAGNIPDEIESLLEDGIQSMLRFRDPGFLAALFDAIRDQAFTREGSDRLLLALQAAGAAAAPLLLDLCDKVTEDENAWGPYALRAKQVALTVLDAVGEDDLEATTEFLLGRMQNANAGLAEEIPSFIGSRVFDRDLSLNAAQRRLILFIDDNTNPDRITWMKGMTAYAPDLPSPHYSWTAEDVADAERRTGLKWAQGGELDTNRILAAIPSTPGSRVSLRQVSTLISQVESFWHPAATGAELIGRLRLAQQVRLDSTRVLILARLIQRPDGLGDGDEASAREMLASLRGSPEVTGWVEFVERVLATPGHAEAVAAETYARHRPKPGILGRLKRLFARG